MLLALKAEGGCAGHHTPSQPHRASLPSVGHTDAAPTAESHPQGWLMPGSSRARSQLGIRSQALGRLRMASAAFGFPEHRTPSTLPRVVGAYLPHAMGLQGPPSSPTPTRHQQMQREQRAASSKADSPCFLPSDHQARRPGYIREELPRPQLALMTSREGEAILAF